MLMGTLYLTTEEKVYFEQYPAKNRKEWTVTDEKQVFDDTKERFMVRISMMKLRSPELLELQEKVKKLPNEQEILKLLDSIKISQIPDEDLFEIFFAIGPKLMTVYILDLLSKQSDLSLVSALTFIRNSILTAFNTATSQWSKRNK